MALLIVGLLLVVAKLAGFGPFANWSWWIVAIPFVGAVLWWQFADASGLTRRREMRKLEERKQERRDKAMSALGLDPKRKRALDEARSTARQRAENLAESDARDIERDRKLP